VHAKAIGSGSEGSDNTRRSWVNLTDNVLGNIITIIL
jgi:hypothetical protein